MLKKRIWKILKYIFIVIGGILILVFAAIYSLQYPSVQNFVKDKLVNYLEGKIKTKVQLDRIYVNFPNKIEIENLYLQGQDVDTLLYVHDLNVGLNLPKLLKNTAEFTSIDLNGLTANVVKRADSTFNFDYIIDAFASKEEDADESKPFLINLDKIRLQKINVTYKDQNSKNDIALNLGDLKTIVQKFDLKSNTYKLDYIDADGFKLFFNQGLLEEVADNVEKKIDSLSEQKPLQIGINKLNLANFDVLYDDENSATKAKIVFKELNASIDKLDLPNSSFEIGKLSTKDLFADVLLTPNSKADQKLQEVSKKEETTSSENNPLKVLLKEADLANVNVIYNNGFGKNTSKSFNANHLDIKELNGGLKDIRLVGTEVSGSLKEVSFIENTGFVLEKLSTKFGYSAKETYLEDLYLKTPNSELQRSLKLNYDSVDDFSKNLGNVALELKLPKSKIGFKDILWIAPDLKNTTPFNKYPNAVLHVSAEAKGKVNDLLLQELKVSGLDNLCVNAYGTIKNALDVKKLSFNLKIDEFKAGKKLIGNLVPKNTIPNSIEIPDYLSAKGRLRGSLDDIYTDLVLASSFGNAQIKGTFNQQRKNAEHYDITTSLGKFDVGRLLKQKDIGIVTATAKIKGTGFDFSKNNVSINAHVNEAIYNKYRYQNISLNGVLNKGNYTVDLNSDDENAKLAISASGFYDVNKPTIKTEGTIFKVDLNKLGFSETPMAIAGRLNADFNSINPDALNGKMLLKDFALSNGEEIYPISEISLEAVSNETINSIDLKSQVFDVALTGKYKLTQISNSLLHTLNQYYHFKNEDQAIKIEPNQYFNFRAKIKNDDLIRKFVPDLTSFATINLYGAYNVDDKKITVYGSIPDLKYAAYQLNDIKLSAGNENDQLNYAVTLKELESEQFMLRNIVLDGAIANDLIDYNLLVKNDNDKVQYKIAGNVATDNDVITVKLKQDGLVLNYEDWKVSDDNSLVMHPKGLVAHNLMLTNNGSSILVTSESDSPESPLNVQFNNFEIATLTEIIRKDELLAEGTINGKAEIKDLTKDLRLTADLNIKDLKVFGNEIGTLDAEVANETAKLYKANVKLSGFENDLTLVGNYDLEQSKFNADLDIKALQMTSIQGFSLGQLRDAKGYISGKINASGSVDQPNILGELKFNDAAFGVTQLNSTFQNINDKILFTTKGIEFDSFKINDTDGNSLTLNGAVLTQTYRDFKFDLSANTRNFKIVNSTKTDNQILYGTMAINANLTVKGDLNLPKVDGQITVTDKTDFTFVMPQSSPALQEREGIIEFVDQDKWNLETTLKDENEAQNKTLSGLDVNVNIEIVKDAKLSIIIDKANGDFIKLQGEAELTGGIDPSGKTTLLGRYEVNEGAYEMSVNVLKRKFDIQKGSSITWTGEPMKATLDITAIYKTKAAPMDLIQQQISALENAAEQNMFKQQIPFNTLLKLSGELLKPEIKFDIEIDGNNPSISSNVISMTNEKLAQLRTEESEMNKQVFALLLLNRFIGENPFESSTGMSAESMARQSVSKLLSQQLNNLAADLIHGVELDFDLESNDDYSTGTKDTRTDLNIGVTKRFFDDRLKVSVGSNFGLEGNERENEKMTNIAGNFEAEYMLSKDGRYLLKAYRKDEYQVALQGQVVETGAGFVITIDYNKFREIINRRKSNREFRRTQRAVQNEEVEKETK